MSEPARHAFADHEPALSERAIGRLRALVASEPEPLTEVNHGRYQLLDTLGAGGMGVVVRCRDTSLERDVAMKIVRADTTVPLAQLAERLAREARILARLEHPGIVPIHDVGMLPDGRVFYVMQWIRGRTLQAQLDAEPVVTARSAVREALDALERVVEAVAFAHDAGVVHRDLKPDNIMIGAYGEVLVTDWGIAKVLGEPDVLAMRREVSAGRAGEVDAPVTSPGTVLGTSGFMAPEQAAGKGHEARATADVYALGAILQRVVSPGADVPRRSALVAIITHCLNPDPAGRYRHAGALLEDLKRYRTGERVSVHAEGLVERLARTVERWKVPIALVASYLLMRVAVAWLGRGL